MDDSESLNAEIRMRPAVTRNIDRTNQRLPRICLGIALVLSCIVAPVRDYATTLKHQASGSVVSRSPSGLVLLKHVGQHQTQWDFVLTRDTQIPPGVTKGVRVTIYYHEDNGHRIADRIKVVAVAGATKAG
jgi:hypothetical protein